MYPLLLTLHIIAATVWVGGHLILSIRFLPKALQTNNPEIIREFEKQYEPIGMPALIILVLTGVWMAFFHYNTILMSFSSPFSRAINLKLIFLLITIAFAIHARFFIIPKLNKNNLKSMALHIIAVTIVGLLMLLTGVQLRFGGI